MGRDEIGTKVILSLALGGFIGYIPVHMFQGEFTWLSLIITTCAGLSLGGLLAIVWLSPWRGKK